MKKIILALSIILLTTGCSNANSLEKIESEVEGKKTEDINLKQESTIIEDKQETTPPTNTNMETSENAPKTATIKTTAGDIVISLMPDIAPKTVANFAAKSQSGFYENLTFHRVEDWVIQGGDPLGNGTGGGTMPTELSDKPFTAGSVGVARGGDIKISNDSQFFICTIDCSWLNGGYTIFGQVSTGMEVAKKIKVGDKIISVSLN